MEPHKILGVSLTRWLAFERVINRIVEQWLPLYLYFLDRVLEVNGTKTSYLALQMNEPDVKVYFLFLSYILKIINDMNKEFQSEKVRLPYLHLHLESNFKLILVNFMYEYEGSYIQIRIIRNVLKFYLELLKQIKRGFDFSREDVKNLVIITLGKVLSNSGLSIELLLKNFGGLATSDPEIIGKAYQLGTEHGNEYSRLLGQFSVFKNGMEEACFQDLTNFLYNLMTLPHSSAAAERKFSDLSLIKSKTRNKLSYKTTILQIMCGQRNITLNEI
uniref:HAT C-terminal dimerisation domain-containing protein n=2 Tax=Bactrocera latifrons TaxID=174628 RepID=A0A0K8U394_BACLA